MSDALPLPISDETLEAQAEVIAKRLRVVRKRAPKAIIKRGRELLESLHVVIHRSEGEDRRAVVARRLELARSLEDFESELRGLRGFVPVLYTRHRLGVVRRYDPIRIKWLVDPEYLDKYMDRFLARADRAIARLEWFYERCGLEIEGPDRPAWLQPYADFGTPDEYLWGRVTSSGND